MGKIHWFGVKGLGIYPVQSGTLFVRSCETYSVNKVDLDGNFLSETCLMGGLGNQYLAIYVLITYLAIHLCQPVL